MSYRYKPQYKHETRESKPYNQRISSMVSRLRNIQIIIRYWSNEGYSSRRERGSHAANME